MKQKSTRDCIHLHREIVSGRAFSLFPDTLRTLRLSNRPIESGRDTKRLEETSNTSSFCSPAIESGRTCFPTPIKQTLRRNITQNHQCPFPCPASESSYFVDNM
jgi:hypothetical protein